MVCLVSEAHLTGGIYTVVHIQLLEYVIPTAPAPPLPKSPLCYGVSPCYGVMMLTRVLVLTRVLALTHVMT